MSECKKIHDSEAENKDPITPNLADQMKSRHQLQQKTFKPVKKASKSLGFPLQNISLRQVSERPQPVNAHTDKPLPSQTTAYPTILCTPKSAPILELGLISPICPAEVPVQAQFTSNPLSAQSKEDETNTEENSSQQKNILQLLQDLGVYLLDNGHMRSLACVPLYTHPPSGWIQPLSVTQLFQKRAGQFVPLPVLSDATLIREPLSKKRKTRSVWVNNKYETTTCQELCPELTSMIEELPESCQSQAIRAIANENVQRLAETILFLEFNNSELLDVNDDQSGKNHPVWKDVLPYINAEFSTPDPTGTATRVEIFNHLLQVIPWEHENDRDGEVDWLTCKLVAWKGSGYKRSQPFFNCMVDCLPHSLRLILLLHCASIRLQKSIGLRKYSRLFYKDFYGNENSNCTSSKPDADPQMRQSVLSMLSSISLGTANTHNANYQFLKTVNVKSFKQYHADPSLQPSKLFGESINRMKNSFTQVIGHDLDVQFHNLGKIDISQLEPDQLETLLSLKALSTMIDDAIDQSREENAATLRPTNSTVSDSPSFQTNSSRVVFLKPHSYFTNRQPRKFKEFFEDLAGSTTSTLSKILRYISVQYLLKVVVPSTNTLYGGGFHYHVSSSRKESPYFASEMIMVCPELVDWWFNGEKTMLAMYQCKPLVESPNLASLGSVLSYPCSPMVFSDQWKINRVVVTNRWDALSSNGERSEFSSSQKARKRKRKLPERYKDMDLSLNELGMSLYNGNDDLSESSKDEERSDDWDTDTDSKEDELSEREFEFNRNLEISLKNQESLAMNEHAGVQDIQSTSLQEEHKTNHFGGLEESENSFTVSNAARTNAVQEVSEYCNHGQIDLEQNPEKSSEDVNHGMGELEKGQQEQDRKEQTDEMDESTEKCQENQQNVIDHDQHTDGQINQQSSDAPAEHSAVSQAPYPSSFQENSMQDDNIDQSFQEVGGNDETLNNSSFDTPIAQTNLSSSPPAPHPHLPDQCTPPSLSCSQQSEKRSVDRVYDRVNIAGSNGPQIDIYYSFSVAQSSQQGCEAEVWIPKRPDSRNFRVRRCYLVPTDLIAFARRTVENLRKSNEINVGPVQESSNVLQTRMVNHLQRLELQKKTVDECIQDIKHLLQHSIEQ